MPTVDSRVYSLEQFRAEFGPGSLEEIEREMNEDLFRATAGNVGVAIRLLGIARVEVRYIC